MNKLMFNDRYGLTEAVLSGKKTQTRRVIDYISQAELNGSNYELIISEGYLLGYCNDILMFSKKLKYKVGEIVAIAQKYKDISLSRNIDGYTLWATYYDDREKLISETAGWKNKMFVEAVFLPHQIEITDVRIERLQEISREDCIKEGIEPMRTQYKALIYGFKDFLKDVWLWKASPKEAYELLISRISGKKVWDENPFVFVYEFKIVK